MAQQTLSKRTLPKRERAFWRKVQKLVLPELAGKVWFPSWWLSSRVPDEFKEFMFDRFSSALPSDEESLHAWCLAVRSIVRYLVDCDEVQYDVLYNYPSCDGFPKCSDSCQSIQWTTTKMVLPIGRNCGISC
jgi:hypothetical protein